MTIRHDAANQNEHELAYRWNPFQEWWEVWNIIYGRWEISATFACDDITVDITNVNPFNVEVSFEDTWCEPTNVIQSPFMAEIFKD